MKKIFIIIFSLAAASVFSQQGWFYLNPTPTGNAIIDVKMFNENTGICISTNELLKTTNAGAIWNKINIPEVYKLTSLSMIDSLKGFMSVDSNKILETTNGGVSWYFKSTILANAINKIYFITEQTGFALQYDGSYWLAVPGKIFRTTNGGISWDSVSKNNNYSRQYYNIFFPSATTGYITGSVYLGNNIFRTQIFKSTNGGLNWDSIANPSDQVFGKIYFLNDYTGYNAGNYGVIKTTDGGLTWKNTRFQGVTPVCIKFFNDTGYCAGGNSLAKTTNGGLNWKYYFPGISNLNCFDLYKTITVAGNTEGKIYFSTNSGTNWSSNSNTITNTQLWDIEFSDKDNGFAIGENNTLLKTSNSGLNWQRLSLGSAGWVGLSSIANVSSKVCYISEWFGNIFKTTKSGLNWITLNTNRYGIERIKFLNENTGFGICKYGEFFKTTDGGVSWYYCDTLHNVESVGIDFIDANTGMVGGSSVYKTTDGGINWQRVTPATFGHVYDIKYLTRDIVFVVSTLNYPLISIHKSTNGGQTWQTQNLNIRNNYFDCLQFPNENIGYALGYDGMYKTTNQGDNWLRINSGSVYGLNGFHFVDSLVGYSAGTNGAILKTTDGGGAPSFIPNFPAYIPDNFYLYQNYPNPFNPTAKIKFNLPKDGNVKIIIFDILGREIVKLTDEKFSAGVHELQWNAAGYSAGVYFYMLLTDNIKETKKMVLVK